MFTLCFTLWDTVFFSAGVLEGHTSDEVEVDSGIPQGAVLGPSMFLSYVNDLPNALSSPVRLIADDTIIYLTIQCENEANQLHDDMNKLAEAGAEPAK